MKRKMETALFVVASTLVPEKLTHRLKVQIEGDDTTLPTLKGDDVRIGSGLPIIIVRPTLKQQQV